jgi:hypothetical protein
MTSDSGPSSAQPRRKRLSRYLRKITIAMAILVALTWALGLFAISQLERVHGTAQNIQENLLPATQSLGWIARNLYNMRVIEARLLLGGGNVSWEQGIAEVQLLDGRITANIRTIQSLDNSDEEIRLFMSFLADLYTYRRRLKANLEHPTTPGAASASLRRSQAAFDSAVATLTELNRVAGEDGRLLREDAEQTFVSACNLILATLGLATLFIVGMLLHIVRHESK